MKKLLLATGILALSAMAFGATAAEGVKQNSNNNTINGEVIVKAYVLQPLTLKTTDIDFGTVMVGQQNVTPKTKGTVTIIGEKDKNVLIALRSANAGEISSTSANSNIDVVLSRVGGTNAQNEQMTAKITATQALAGKGVSLGATGEIKFDLGGTLDVSVDQASGDYQGTFYVSTRYE